MFNNISWQSYWTAIAITTTGYYLFIYLIYFRSSVGIIIQKKGKEDLDRLSFIKKENQQPSLLDHEESDYPSFTEDEPEHVLYACMDELNALLDNQKKSKAVKGELMFALRTILEKYPTLRNSDYKTSITNVIATQCESICSIHLSADELNSVWSGSE